MTTYYTASFNSNPPSVMTKKQLLDDIEAWIDNEMEGPSSNIDELDIRISIEPISDDDFKNLPEFDGQ